MACHPWWVFLLAPPMRNKGVRFDTFQAVTTACSLEVMVKKLEWARGGLLGCVVSFKLKLISSVTCFRSSSMIVEGTSKTMKKSDYWERIWSNKRRPTRIQKRNLCVSSKRYIYIYLFSDCSKVQNSQSVEIRKGFPYQTQTLDTSEVGINPLPTSAGASA